MTSIIISLTLGATIFLCLLNIAFAVVFRKRRTREVVCYIAAALIEVVIFVFALTIRLRLLHSVPFHLPPGLPFNRAQIGAAVALGLGLFPAAYWHRTSVRQLRKRLEEDAKVLKEQEKSVRVRNSVPGEWMN